MQKENECEGYIYQFGMYSLFCISTYHTKLYRTGAMCGENTDIAEGELLPPENPALQNSLPGEIKYDVVTKTT